MILNISIFTKQLCRFLIHRYMGQYLKTELSSDQLELHLASGTASLQGVMLNTEYINEALDTSGIKIVSLVDGYVQELTVEVPWKKLLHESTVIRVSGLQLTLTPLAEINMANTQELVNSVIGSITTSMDLAKSVIVDEELSSQTDNVGIEQFATIIDQIISRIKIIFENITIRIESYSEVNDLCRGIEVQIDRMEFLDEHLEEQIKNANETITEQPERLYTVTDLNKLLHIQGVRLYTDIWTPLKSNKLTNSQINSSDSEGDTSEMANSTFNSTYQSCYSHFSSRSNSNTAARPHNSIAPSPILFAQLFSEKHTLRIRVNNCNAVLHQTDNAYFNKRVEIDVFLGGPLYVFLTPSQIALIKDLLSLLAPKEQVAPPANPAKFGGLPMQQEHYNRMMDQMQGETRNTHGFTVGTWSGAEQFFDLSEHFDLNAGHKHPQETNLQQQQQQRIRSCSLNSEKPLLGHGNRQSTASNSTLVERRPDIFSFSVRAPCLVAIITHDDPLSKDSVRERSDGCNMNSTVQTIVNEMGAKAEHFFKTAATLKLNRKKLQEQRLLLSNLYGNDHLRLIANGFMLTTSLITDSQRNIMEIAGHLDECDFVECLRMEGEQKTQQIIDILCLSNANNRSGMASRSVLNFCLKNSPEKQHDYSLNIDMESCKTELDPSIMDRISNLLFIQPFFSLCKESSHQSITGLDDNLFPDAMQEDLPIAFSVKLYCSNWLLHLRIPIADFSKTEEITPEYWRRKLHPEFLKFELEGAELELPRTQLNDMYIHGALNLQAKTAKGTFIGDPKVLECTEREMTFFCAEATNAERTMGIVYGIKLKMSFDNRNKSLSKVLINGESLMMRSMTESIFATNEQDKIEGPFSTKDTFHFKDSSGKASDGRESSQKLIKAGNRRELDDFAEECRYLSNFLIDVTVSQLNFALPSKKFFEVLYNRLAYDLALFQPKSPKFYTNQSKRKEKHFMECQSAFIVAHDDEELEMDSSGDELSERTFTSRRSFRKSICKRRNKESHNLSIGVHVDRTRLLLQNCTGKDINDFTSQFGTELIQEYFFLVYGFKGDPNLSYFFSTSSSAEFFHKNILDNCTPFSSNVLDSHTFSLPRLKENIFLNEVPKVNTENPTEDDNFVVSMRMHFHPETNTKDVLLTLGLRNSLLHLRPLSNLKLFGATQFAGFFNVDDYAVSGYEPPAVNIDLRLHLSNLFLSYDHSAIVAGSPFQFKFEIGSSYVSTNLVPGIERLKFDCIFEDIKFWMRKKPSETVKFETVQSRFLNPTNHFVKILMADSIHFVLAYSILLDEKNLVPSVDFACADQNLTLWLCSDTIIEILNVLKEFAYSDTIKSFLASLKPAQDDKEELPKKSADEEPQGGVPNPRTGIRRNVSISDEQRLIREMEAAMNDMPILVHTNKRQFERMLSADIDEDDSPQSSSTNNTDDEFIVIDKVPARQARPPGFGVTQMGNRFQTQFDSGGDFEFVTTQINLSSTAEAAFDQIPLSPPLISYKMSFSTLTIFLFGGSDFTDSSRSLAQNTYSQWETNRDLDRLKEVGSQSGRFRDHTVFVEIKFSRLSSVCKFFGEDCPNLSRVLLELGDFNIIDHLTISNINEMVHRLEFERQPRSSAPFLKLFLNEDQLREAILEISLAPIRLNLDQDTFDFLTDFRNNLTQGLKNVFDIPVTPRKNDDDRDVPVMEIPKASCSKVEEKIYPGLSRQSSSSMSFNILKEKDEEMGANIDERFSEDDVNLSDSMFDKFLEGKESEQQQREESAETKDEDDAKSKDETSAPSQKDLAAKELQIKKFTFSPACHLRIDYEAKQRIRTDQQGPFTAFLIGMMNLKKTEIVLKEFQHERKQLCGFRKCAEFAIEEWKKDIIEKQIPGVVGSIAVINAVVQLAQGFKDLVALPLEEYNKEDGQLSRGIQKGTTSFGLNTATAAIDATQRVVGLLQNVAEITYDILNPNFIYRSANQRMQIAGDLREGISLACNTVREGFVDTAQTLQSAAQQDRAQGGWGMGILRHITPTAIKPIVVASKATSHVLGGLKNQLKPEEHKEEMRKWRHNASGKQGLEQLRRSSSNSLNQPSTSRAYDNHSPRKNW